MDSKADLLIYGMGERTVLEIAEALEGGIDVSQITWIRGTCYRADKDTLNNIPPEDRIMLPSFESITGSKRSYAASFRIQHDNMDSITAKALVEEYPGNSFVVQNPPQAPLEKEELDDIYELPFENEWHPYYNDKGGIPAFKEIKFSVVSSRGCFGGCSFCAITYHQGRQVRGRSRESIVNECRALTGKPDFKGYIHDVGGPTANFRFPACEKQLTKGVCNHRDCLYPGVCKAMKVDHEDYLKLLREVRNLPGVKKVFIRSGIRYDYLMADPKADRFIEELVKYHVSGTLKVAPEHISDKVLYYMRKPSKKVFLDFVGRYKKANERLGLRQYLIPYLISSHPGSTLEDAVELALFLKDYGFVPDQVQDFYPTPGTMATCMYYTGVDPMTMEPVYVARDMEEKRMQRALMHYNKPENRDTVIKALKKAGREDLIPVLLRPSGRKPGAKNSGHAKSTNNHVYDRKKRSLK